MTRRLRILVGFACSGRLRRALCALGHDAWECDLKPSWDGGPHIVGDAFEVAERGDWDLGIFHPDCTYLTGAAEWAFAEPDFQRFPGVGYHQRVKPGTLTGSARRDARAAALIGIRRLMALPYPKAIENPVGAISSAVRRPDQVIQPHEFGDDASKATCLWLDRLPLLTKTRKVEGRLVEWPRGSGRMVRRYANQTDAGQNRLSPSDNRAAMRSETFPGVAAAMAAQWAGNAIQSDQEE